MRQTLRKVEICVGVSDATGLPSPPLTMTGRRNIKSVKQRRPRIRIYVRNTLETIMPYRGRRLPAMNKSSTPNFALLFARAEKRSSTAAVSIMPTAALME